MVQRVGVGAPHHYPERVVWAGWHRLAGGRRIPVWPCEGHREEVEDVE